MLSEIGCIGLEQRMISIISGKVMDKYFIILLLA